MQSENPENEPSGSPSTPAGPTPEPEIAKQGQEAEPSSPERILDAGTSQELLIVRYGDDSFLHPRHREMAGDPSDGAEPADARETPPDDPSLIIVRDVLSPDFQQTLRPPSPTAPETAVPEPPETGEAPATAPAKPSSDEALPAWARRAAQGTYAPPPPLPGRPIQRAPSGATQRPPSATTPAPTALDVETAAPRPESGAATLRPPSGEARAPAPTKPSRDMILNRDIDDLFVKPDFSKSKTPPAAHPSRPARATRPAAPPPLPPRPQRKSRPSAVAAAPAPPPRARRRRSEGGAGVLSTIAAIVAALAFAGSCALAVTKVEPFYTWWYLFAWYPFLVIVNHLTATHSREHSIFSSRARTVGALAAWSVPVWLFFELVNFRLQDWYYVGVPDAWAARRLGVALSFATVLPGIFFLEEMLRVRGAFERVGTRAFEVTSRLGKTLVRVGLVWLVLLLALPTFFYPLLWGVPVLLLEPWLVRRGDPSLLGELAAGRPDRVLRLLVAGMICGLFWESANFIAGGRWIYTVPGFQHGKLFEMPFLGFVGFPPFALACWSMARALVQVGLLPDWDATATATEGEAGASDDGKNGKSSLSKGTRISLVAWAVVAAFAVFEGMDRWTIDSFTARPENVPGIPDGVAQYAHRHGYHDVRGLMSLIHEGRLHVPGVSSEQELLTLREHCRLVLLKGIGTANARRLDAVGVHSVEELAAREGSALAKALQGAEPGWTPKPRRVEVWVQAARADSRH